MMSDHLNNALNNFRGWLEKGEGSNLHGVEKAIIDEYDVADQQNENLVGEIQIETATGQYLDQIGAIFKIARGVGETDDALRARIKAYFQTYSNTATEDAIKNAVFLSTGIPLTGITVTQVYPGLIKITLTDPVPGEVLGVVKAATMGTKAAGIVLTTDFDTSYDEGVAVRAMPESITISPLTYWQEGASLVDGDNIVP
jgi:hypothetical protein